MSYILEWQAGAVHDPSWLIRQLRVFRSASGLKTFLRSRAFRRLASEEIRLQRREGGRVGVAVITTVTATLGWSPEASALPPPLVHSAWADALNAMNVRGHLIERMAAELGTAVALDLLTREQIAALMSTLQIMLAESAARAPPAR